MSETALLSIKNKASSETEKAAKIEDVNNIVEPETAKFEDDNSNKPRVAQHLMKTIFAAKQQCLFTGGRERSLQTRPVFIDTPSGSPILSLMLLHVLVSVTDRCNYITRRSRL